MRDWWKAVFILFSLATAAGLLLTIVLQLVPDPVQATARRMELLGTSWPFPFLPQSPLWWWLVAGVAATAILYVLARLREAKLETISRMFVPAPVGAPPVNAKTSRAEAECFQEAVMNPSARFTRITESVEAYTRSLKVRTTFLIRADGLPLRDGVAIPVVLSAKGRLENGLAFLDSSGSRISSMNRSETMTHLAGCIRSLYVAGTRFGRPRYSAKDPSGRSIEDRVWRLIANDHGPNDDPTATAALNADAEALYLMLMNTRGADRERMFNLCGLIGELIWNYPICLRIGPLGDADATRVTVERRVVPELFGAGSVALQLDGADGHSQGAPKAEPRGAWIVALATRVLDALRRFAGVPASVITHDLTNAARAASYHLQIAGPAGYYAARLRLLDQLGERISPVELGAEESDSATLRGQRHVHLYLRGAASARDTKFQAGFYERTPGSMAVAAAAALATLVVAGIIAAAQVGAALGHCEEVLVALMEQCVKRDPAQTGASEGLLQILLTFPIALVAMSAKRNDAVWGGVLVARVTNAAVVLLTLAALALSVFANAFTPTGLSVAWIVIIGSMLVVLCAATTSWILRSLIHIRYVRNAAS